MSAATPRITILEGAWYLDRLTRRLFVKGGLMLSGAAASAQGESGARSERIRLWPGAPPLGGGRCVIPQVENARPGAAHSDRWFRGIAEPHLVVSRPARPNGSAVMLIPGGGYSFLALDKEGTAPAAWLNLQGVTAFTLVYRLPREGWGAGSAAALHDAQRGMRLIRAQAKRFGIRSDRIAVLGFSAGGHLAGMLAGREAPAPYPPIDDTDRLPTRPDVAGLLYPVVTMTGPFAHASSRESLLGAANTDAKRQLYSVENLIGPSTSPMFIVHAADDKVVPIENSLLLYEALRREKRPGELHLFDEGGHGFATTLPPVMPASAWPHLFTTFCKRHFVK